MKTLWLLSNSTLYITKQIIRRKILNKHHLQHSNSTFAMTFARRVFRSCMCVCVYVLYPKAPPLFIISHSRWAPFCGQASIYIKNLLRSISGGWCAFCITGVILCVGSLLVLLRRRPHGRHLIPAYLFARQPHTRIIQTCLWVLESLNHNSSPCVTSRSYSTNV